MYIILMIVLVFIDNIKRYFRNRTVSMYTFQTNDPCRCNIPIVYTLKMKNKYKDNTEETIILIM